MGKCLASDGKGESLSLIADRSNRREKNEKVWTYDSEVRWRRLSPGRKMGGSSPVGPRVQKKSEKGGAT